MVLTPGADKKHHPRNTQCGGNVQQVTACAENRWGTESSPDRTYLWWSKRVAETYLLSVWESQPLKVNKSTPANMDRRNRYHPKMYGRHLQKSKRKWFVWRLPIIETKKKHLLTEGNPSGDLIINTMELAANFLHLQIVRPLMEPIFHISPRM